MAAGSKVQLRLGERVVAEVSFREDALRIGRMKENDLVINNLAVSRFHAVLRRTDEGYEIEDLGSENGTFVNGTQVSGRAPVPAGGEIKIGKHALSISGDADENLPAPRARASDAWDAAQTYFAPGLVAPATAPSAPAAAPVAPAAAPAAPAAPAPASVAPAEDEAEVEELVEAEALEEGAEDAASFEPSPPGPLAASAHDHPDPAGLYAFGEDDLHVTPAAAPAADFGDEFDVPAPAAVEQLPAGAPGQTALFDFGATDDLGLSDPSLARVVASRAEAFSAAGAEAFSAAGAEAPAAPASPAPPGHAGLIVSREGRVERVAPFTAAELIVGRGASCDLVLASAGVSRRHARFEADGGRHRVLDLGSANGVRVNGESVREHVLAVGDVVGIDEYTLTFVIDHEPLDVAVRSTAAAPGPSALAQTAVLEDEPPTPMLEQDLLVSAEEDEAPLDAEKELEAMLEVATAPARVDPDWVVELALDQLPEPLRRALGEMAGGELRLPVELRIRRR